MGQSIRCFVLLDRVMVFCERRLNDNQVQSAMNVLKGIRVFNKYQFDPTNEASLQ